MSDNNGSEETVNEKVSPAISTVVGIRFRSCGKIYTFEVGDIDVTPGTRVVVDSEMGLSIGNVVTSKKIIEKTKEPLKKVLRIATDKDYETVQNNRAVEEEARLFCIEKAKSLNLQMKIVSTETTMDKKRFIFYFTADGRIDFRELVRDLASKFKTRIEMRQIGVRDEVKLLGGFGCCGRQTCCSLFLTSFEPITIRMAKEQALSINQSKLSGICGRLMCCLGYEHREASTEEATPKSQDESLVTVTEEISDNGIQTVVASIPELEETKGNGQPSRRDNTVDENAKPVPSSQEKAPGKTGHEKRHFKRARRRRHKNRSEKAPSGDTSGKQQEKASTDKTAPSETKGKGRPFNKRRKFWKKKQK